MHGSSPPHTPERSHARAPDASGPARAGRSTGRRARDRCRHGRHRGFERFRHAGGVADRHRSDRRRLDRRDRRRGGSWHGQFRCGGTGRRRCARHGRRGSRGDRRRPTRGRTQRVHPRGDPRRPRRHRVLGRMRPEGADRRRLLQRGDQRNVRRSDRRRRPHVPEHAGSARRRHRRRQDRHDARHLARRRVVRGPHTATARRGDGQLGRTRCRRSPRPAPTPRRCRRTAGRAPASGSSTTVPVSGCGRSTTRNASCGRYLVTGSQYNNEMPGVHEVYSKSEVSTAWNGAGLPAAHGPLARHRARRDRLPRHPDAHQRRQPLPDRRRTRARSSPAAASARSNLDAQFMWAFADIGTTVIVT